MCPLKAGTIVLSSNLGNVYYLIRHLTILQLLNIHSDIIILLCLNHVARVEETGGIRPIVMASRTDNRF